MLIRVLKYLVFILSLLATTQLFANNYQRIISLDICSDWILARYAKRTQVIAMSPLLYQYPIKAEHQDWPTHDGSLEKILQLKPDLVITGEFNASVLRARLKELGVHVETTALPRSLNALQQYIQQFINLLGTGVVLPILKKKPFVEKDAPRLLLLNANANATGTGTLEDEILQQAGWRNYVKQSGYGKVDLEQLVQDPPDAILWSAPASPAMANALFEHPALKKAMLNKPVLVLDDGRWQCAGPWTWQQIETLTNLRVKWFTK